MYTSIAEVFVDHYLAIHIHFLENLCVPCSAGTGLAGMRQRDLIQWYVSQQNEKNNYDFVEEAAAEISKIKAIIEVNLLFHRTLMLAKNII